MIKRDLSIVIPARNEEFLSRTIDDLLSNIEGNTDIIVVLDGEWANPPIVDNERVRIIYHPESIGQRAATNEAVKISNAKYIAKADAHCAFDKGFDIKMIEAFKEVGDNVTMVPIMRNLHVFDWVCPKGHRRYQGPSGVCKECSEPTVKDIVWNPKPSPASKSYCFDPEPHFQYFKEFEKRPEGRGDLTESMSLQGSFFMLTREKYWELNVSDESFGSWGSQGIEVACKTWLSGGRVIVNHRTWYAHLFRTQGGDFSFPYQQSGRQVEKAKRLARSTFIENKWPLQKKPLSWLVEKFWPIHCWKESDLLEIKKYDANVGVKTERPKKGIIYYTDNQLNLKIAHAVQDQLRKISLQKDIPIVSASLKKMEHFGKNVHLRLERGILTYFKQILAALEASEAEFIFFCEHDVLYPASHFDFEPQRKDTFYYDHNWWKVRLEDNFAAHWDADQVSGLCVDRDFAIAYYKQKVAEFNQETFNRSYEPGSGINSESWKAPDATVDIRQPGNMTKSKWSLDDFRDKSTAKNFETGAPPEWVKDILQRIR